MLKSKKFIALTAAVVLATTTAAALAATGTLSTKDNALQQSRFNAVQAVDIAVQKVGGVAESVDFKHKNGSSYFEVDVIAGNQKHEVKIDAASGQVLNSKVENNHDTDSDSAQLQQTGVSLHQAISAAVAKTGGVAKEAEWENENGQSYYKVETIANGQEYDVKIDAQNGSVMSAQIDKDDDHDHHDMRNTNN